MAPAKVVVVGDVNGQIETVIQKLGALHAKQNFAFAIIVGNLLKDPEESSNEDVETITKLINGKISVPLTTYFALGSTPLPEKIAFKLESSAGELCPNLYFMGKRTTTKTSDGIRIVSLGGTLNPQLTEPTSDAHSSSYSEADVKALRGAKHADILVTSEWPEGIRKGSKVDWPPGQDLAYREPVADLCGELKPRYHFTRSPDVFYEREPFFNPAEAEDDDGTFKITRFISLAAFGNPNKQKWIYAFSMDPTAAAPLSIPPGTTSTPLTSQRRKRAPQSDPNSFRYSNDTGNADSRSRKRQKHGKRGAPPGPDECFFCLSNANVATHLITSIGNECYLTTAKGPLTTSTTFSTLDFPAHMLVIPLVHAPTLNSIDDEESRTSTLKEMTLYRTALNNMLKKLAPDTGSVTWEVSRADGVHIHWQWLPISRSLIARGLVDGAFKVEAENQKYPSFEKGSPEDEGDYFRVTVWDPVKNKDASIFLPLDSSFRFDIQFGRRVLAKLIGLDGRADWRECGQTEKDEEKDAAEFKKAFKEFDFSLDE